VCVCVCVCSGSCDLQMSDVVIVVSCLDAEWSVCLSEITNW